MVPLPPRGKCRALIVIREHASVTILSLLAPAVFYGLAKAYHIISTPGICPSYSGFGGRGDGVVLGGGCKRGIFVSTVSEMVWFKCRWLQATPFLNKTNIDRFAVSGS